MYGVPAKPHDATRYMYVLFDTADVRHRHTSTHALEEHETLYSFMCIDTWLAVISDRTAFSPIPSLWGASYLIIATYLPYPPYLRT